MSDMETDGVDQSRPRPMRITVTPVDRSRIPELATLHVEAFQSFFLTSLGPRFLRSLYGAIERDPTGLVLAATDDATGRVLGFAAGTRESKGCFSRLLRRQPIAFAWAALPRVWRSPRIVPRVLRSIRRPAHEAGTTAGALLMSIAVDPKFSGQGIGGQLLESFLDRMAQDGVQAVLLTTDHDANEAANAFYLRHGFQRTRRFVTSEGRRMNEYAIELESRKQRTAA